MARKLSTKATREAVEKAKLHARLMDFAIGANGGCDLEADDGSHQLWSMGVAAFGRFLRCLDMQLLSPTREYLIMPMNFEHFETIETAVDFLFSHGVRADSTTEDTP